MRRVLHNTRAERGALACASVRECPPTVCFDPLPVSNDAFQAAALHELAFLVEDYGFRLVEEGDQAVRYASPSVVVDAVLDPRGEVELRASRLNDPDPHATLTLHGVAGRASAGRVVELLAAQLRDEDAALRGDADFFERLAAVQRDAAKAWTAYYSGEGPRPETGRVP
jgi:hypothetical protein